ncbi:MAG: sigma factor-like helix-turn-helix DNA-binding protein [Chryseolinea sp.]
MAIDRLPETEGLLVILYYVNENSIREIQHITGLTVPNIKIKLFRARKKLERELRFLLDH